MKKLRLGTSFLTRTMQSTKNALSLIVVIALIFCIQSQSPAEELGYEYTEDFFPDGKYDSAIPTPEKIIGFPVGSRPCLYQEVVSYFKTLAASSPRAVLKSYGTTHEGRTLYYLIISSEEIDLLIDTLDKIFKKR